jgi:hypothetical protein
MSAKYQLSMKWRGVNSGQLMSAINLNNNGSSLSIGNVNGSENAGSKIQLPASMAVAIEMAARRRLFNIMAENQ